MHDVVIDNSVFMSEKVMSGKFLIRLMEDYVRLGKSFEEFEFRVVKELSRVQ